MQKPLLKSLEQVGHMRKAGLVVAEVHKALAEACEPGKTTAELDQVAYQVTKDLGAAPNFLHYQGFPASVCISVNEEIVHGIPGQRIIKEGDIVSFDCGAKIMADGKPWHADAAFTMIAGDAVGSLPNQLSSVTKTAMWAGVASCATAKKINDIGAAVEDSVDESTSNGQLGFVPELIEGYTGHGIGNHLHEEPTVFNYRTCGRSPKVRPGMVLCIEPMVVAGDRATAVLEDDWTVVTVDGALSAHWEHTVAILEDGISVLTAFDSGKEGLAPFGITPIIL